MICAIEHGTFLAEFKTRRPDKYRFRYARINRQDKRARHRREDECVPVSDWRVM